MKVYIFINGILTLAGDQRDWNYRACVWTQLKTDVRAMPIEYFCGPIGRAFGQKKRASKVSQLLQAFAGHDITLVGHSNGAAVALDALQQGLVYPRVSALHLVSAACEADFDKNGLNSMMQNGYVGNVSVYCGGQDMALRLASCWAARLIGYGVLGLHGPKNVLPSVATRVSTVRWKTFGHSSCWRPENFDTTMRMFFSQDQISGG